MAAVDADVQPLFKKTRFATLSDETLKSILKDKHLENLKNPQIELCVYFENVWVKRKEPRTL